MSRRRNRRPRRTSQAVSQQPWSLVRNPYAPAQVMSDDQVECIIDRALTVLETVGMRFLEPGSRQRLATAGANVDEADEMVRFDRDLVREQLMLAPSGFDLRARNPAHDLTIGGNNIVFSAVGGPAFCSDLDRGRRPGTYEDMCNYLRLVQSLNIIHQEGGGPFEPMDLPVETRHLDLYHAQLTLTDKNAQAYALGYERTRDCLVMTAMALGITEAQLAERPAVLAIINTNSPRQLDIPMTEALCELARTKQVACITPFTLAGSMSPATMAGTLVQQTAEVLAAVVLAQLVQPGAPVMYGEFASNVDMRSGAPALGTPEYSRMAIASCQIARKLGLPSRSSNTTTANCVDAQSAYESQMSLWASITGHANMINHAAGWLESGLTASFEKLIVDAEMLQMMAETLKPIEFSEDELAVDAIGAVEPGGHHFGTEHTLARYETAFYNPLVSDRQNFETWTENGAKDTATRANEIWKALLTAYEPPPIDAGIAEQLTDYVARRKAGEPAAPA